jgi:hypothetical protein
MINPERNPFGWNLGRNGKSTNKKGKREKEKGKSFKVLKGKDAVLKTMKTTNLAQAETMFMDSCFTAV